MKNKLQKNTITKNQLLQNNTQLIRVLDMEADRVFIIDCIKRTMPVWKDAESIKEYVPCTEDTLQEITDTFLIDLDNVDSESRKTAYERYTMIAPLLPFVSDLKKRKELKDSSFYWYISNLVPYIFYFYHLIHFSEPFMLP